MNFGIFEGLQARGARSDTTGMEMLPGNHKDELPLMIYSVSTFPHKICCLGFIFIYLLLSVPSLSALNVFPLHGSFSNRVRQVHCSLWAEINYFLSQA